MKKLLLAALVALAFVQQVSAVCPTNPPTLQTPGNNAVVSFGNVMFDWTDVTNATGYVLWHRVDGGTWTSDITIPSDKTLLIGPGHSVEWKAVAKATSCTDQESVHWFFTTSCPTIVPVLQDPDPAEVFAPGEVITFNWTPMAGADSYDLRVTPDFGNTFQTIAAGLTTTTFTTDALPEGDWGWHVKVNFSGSCGPFFSQPSSFKVTSCQGAIAPTLTSPASNATVAQPITFSWTNVNADQYELHIEQANATKRLETTRGTSFVIDGLDAGAYSWYVVAKNDNCPDAATGRRTVNVQAADGCPTGKATLVSPAANASNLSSPVTFDWNPVANATGYRVFAAFGNGEAAILGTTSANTTQLAVKLPTGSGVWFVQTLFGDNCPTTLSERRAFTVTQGASCPTVAPQLVSPANGQHGVNGGIVIFDWSPVPDAIGYALYIATGGSDRFELYGTTDAATTQIERLVPSGEIDWFVVARYSECPDIKSSIFKFFSDADCRLDPVKITSPSNGAEVNSPVTITWNPVANATSYRITLRGQDGANVFSTRTTTTSQTQRLPAGKFIVQVEALREECASSSSNIELTVKVLNNCSGNATPVLVSPVGTETAPAQTQSPATLTWNPVANALGYRIFLGRDGGPFEDVALSMQTSHTLELEPGRYRWFIQAFFEGCNPTESPVAFFVVPDTGGCTRQPPQVVSPANNATVTAPVTIKWIGVDGALRYRVLALVNDKLTLLGSTEETELTRPLIPGDYTIVVQAEFEECASTESSRVHFTVRRAQTCPTEAPTLIAPANGSTTTDPDVEFSWSPVSGALEYAVVAKVDDGVDTIIGTTDMTQLRRRMPAGKITWFVAVIVPGCDPLRSQRFTVTVQRPQGCSDRKPVLLFPVGAEKVPTPIEFSWIGVPNASEYRIWVAQGAPMIVATTTETHARVDLDPGRYPWFVEARFEGNCPSTFSAVGEVRVVEREQECDVVARPEANVLGQAVSGVSYQLRWTPLSNVSSYEVQESMAADFANASSFTAFRPAMKFKHEASGAPVRFFYRVRGVSNCSDKRGPYSEVVSTYVIDPKTNNASTELGGDEPITQKVFLPGGSTPRTFTATMDKPGFTVTPSNGTVPVEGLTLNVTGDPAKLGIGTNTATLRVTYGASAKGIATNDETTVSLPLSLSLVTPVMPSGKGTPPPDALIFAAVGHAAGINDSLFESDIRLTNLTAQTKKYDLNFTPSGVDGTLDGITSTIEVPPGVTMALDDVVATAFGSGTVGSSLGMLEIRPVDTTEESGGLFGSVTTIAQQQIQTAASSRTYNFTPTGTFGQFIPATPFANFVGRNSILSLQQVAQSLAFRANFGFLEASGQPVELEVRAFDTANNLLARIPVSLGAMQHRQLNGLLQSNGINDLTDGRVEVEVMSGDGKVTAYVSEVDNATNDPLLVSPVVKGAVSTNRYIVPGMAYINTGAAFWVSDLRVFNAGSAATPATLTFYPMGNPAGAMTRDITLNPGEIKVLNNVLVNTFGVSATAGGSIVVTTPTDTSLIATARTYNQTSNGTYGQYIPGVTVADAVGVNDRALQILQVEQSTRIRTNIGLNETTGKPATVEVSLITPDSLTTPVVTIGLQPNEFRQIGLLDFALPDAVYNGRVTIKVIDGEGKVTGYGSAIDQITQDPTYVPPI